MPPIEIPPAGIPGGRLTAGAGEIGGGADGIGSTGFTVLARHHSMADAKPTNIARIANARDAFISIAWRPSANSTSVRIYVAARRVIVHLSAVWIGGCVRLHVSAAAARVTLDAVAARVRAGAVKLRVSGSGCQRQGRSQNDLLHSQFLP